MKILFFSFILILTSLYSCSTDVHKSLSHAGENKEELEKVLRHYQDEDCNPLKYKAACFLIKQMKYHNSFYSNKLPEILCEAANQANKILTKNPQLSPYRSATMALDSITARYGNLQLLAYQTRNDAQTISAHFLINDIDFAFRTWEKVPWGKQISFHDFCTQILPYRVYNEYVTNWRETYYNTFSCIIDSLPANASQVEACAMLYKKVLEKQWYHVDDIGTPYVDAISLLNNRYGGCREKATFMLLAMRALCIPGSIDMFLQTPNKMYRYHYWNHIKDELNNPIEFLIGDDHLTPRIGSKDTTRKRGVIYRLCFDIQKESLITKESSQHVPERLKNPFIKNVSKEYYPDSKITIDTQREKEKYLFLCLFNNKEWIPVIYSTIKNGKASFYGIEPNIIYLPAYFKNGKIVPASSPFLLQEKNNLHFFNPDTTKRQDMVLERKHPLPDYLFHLKRFLIGGTFQVSNRADFHQAKSIYTILDANELRRTFITLNLSEKYRYIRYMSADNGWCNMAELSFYTKDGTEITGAPIGTSESKNQRVDRSIHAVFDKNPLTFFEAPTASGGWVGLDFGSLQKINKIEFQFRNDDNLIRKGDSYELFYFSNKKWVSAGKKTGSDLPYLIYSNMPKNAVYLLHNHTRGKEERIFTYENGKQIWW